jgi:DNA-binding beta-propeller fold protein YncE
VTATVAVNSEPTGVTVDTATHTAYVTNSGDNNVSVISAAARPAPVITLTSSPNPSTFGQNVTFTATAAPADGGTITFSNGAAVLCRAVPHRPADQPGRAEPRHHPGQLPRKHHR